MFLPVFHLSAAAMYTYTIVYDQLYIDLPLPTKDLEVLPLKARVLFLTMWCLGMQTIYFYIALLNDTFGTNAPAPKSSPFIRRIKDTLFSLAFPVAIYVSLAFWAIYAVDKEMIFPDYIERAFPKWVNHVMHTTVAVNIVIELLSTNRNYPPRSTGVAIFIAFNIAYITWIALVYIKTGVWVYPILEHFNWLARGVFVAVSVSVALLFYLLGEKVNYIVCASARNYYTNGKASPNENYTNGKAKSS